MTKCELKLYLAKHYELTISECNCIMFFMDGMTTKEIAFKLKLKNSTVKNFIWNARKKMGIKSLSELTYLLELLAEKTDPNLLPPGLRCL